MEIKTSGYKIKLGIFISIGLALLFLGIFIIGKQKNLFDQVFKIHTKFRNISGLLVGNNIRFSGINVGTVDQIDILNDTTVVVYLLIKQDVHPFLKSDCMAGIRSDGLIGDKVLVITHGSDTAGVVKNGQEIASLEPVETDQIIYSLHASALNAEIITEQLAQIMLNINGGQGVLGRMISDTAFSENIDQTILNLKRSSKGLNENMNAAKDNFLLKPYFNRKKKAAKKRQELQSEDQKQQNAKQD